MLSVVYGQSAICRSPNGSRPPQRLHTPPVAATVPPLKSPPMSPPPSLSPPLHPASSAAGPGRGHNGTPTSAPTELLYVFPPQPTPAVRQNNRPTDEPIFEDLENAKFKHLKFVRPRLASEHDSDSESSDHDYLVMDGTEVSPELVYDTFNYRLQIYYCEIPRLAYVKLG